MKYLILNFWVVGVLLSGSCSDKLDQEVSIVPNPVELYQTDGFYKLTDGLTIGISGRELIPAGEYLKSMIEYSTGYRVSIDTVLSGKPDIKLSKGERQENETYNLTVDGDGVEISGSSYGAVISGIASLRQLLPPQFESPAQQNKGITWNIPKVVINDSPRFAWRGMMLDVARHFYDKEEVKKFLDFMALYKLNKFHWHLTDDQGWRVEIEKYPLLTEKGAWRKFNGHDKSCMNLAKSQMNPDFNIPASKLKIIDGDTLYGGFYTREDIKEIVAYAAQRGIDVIPEVDVPGHSLAAINNYPELACDGKIGWGQTFSSPLCPGKESTLDFYKNVYGELFTLFPYEYVHLGADEVEKANWKKCPACQKKIKQNGLKNEDELQAWFVREMEKYFKGNGKKLIGWDEITEENLSNEATVMWWRSWAKDAVLKAADKGNRIIMAPNANLYFDYQQDKNTLKGVYDLDPVLSELTQEQAELIVGVQANTWTEWIPSMERLEYLITPRIAALSEIAWVQPERKDWNDFLHRLPLQFTRFDMMGINYRIPDLEGFYQTNVFTDSMKLDIRCLLPGVEIRYTTDSTVPTKNSLLYTAPLVINESVSFTFRTFRPDGTAGDITRTGCVKEIYADPLDSINFRGKGLNAVWHDYRGESCRAIEQAPVKGEYIVKDVRIPDGVKGNIGLVIEGYIQVPVDSVYTFALMSDDGSLLAIDDQLLIDNDGGHSPREIIAQRALKKGIHSLRIHYFDYNGGMLKLRTLDKNGNYREFPQGYFKY